MSAGDGEKMTVKDLIGFAEGYRAPALAHHAPTFAIGQCGKPIRGTLFTIIRTFLAAVTRRAGRELKSG